MSVAVKAKGRVLVVETRGSIELIKDVAPFVRRIERRVYNCEIAHLPDHLEVPQPLLVFLTELSARPVDRFLREWVEAAQVFRHGSLFVVIAFDHWTIKGANDFDAFVRVCIVADNIAETDVVRHPKRFSVG